MNLSNELNATYKLVYRDLSASLIPGILIVLSALITSKSEFNQVVIASIGAFIYFSLYRGRAEIRVK